MKKFFLLLLMAVVFCGSADAQKGMKGLGVNINGNVTNELLNIGASAKFQYNISNYFRVEASAAFYTLSEDHYPNEKESGFESAIIANTHFFVMSPKRIRPYFIAGIGYASFNEEYKGYNYSYSNVQEDGLAANVGIGVDWRITSFLSLQAECGILSILTDGTEKANGFAFGIGTSYNF